MMKRLMTILLAMVLMVSAAFALAEDAPRALWRGKLTHNSRLRQEKNKNSTMLDSVKEGDWLDLYEYYDSGWYLASVDGKNFGYIAADRVYELWPLTEDVDVPGYVRTDGIATLNQPVVLTGKGLTSNELPAGTMIPVRADGTLPFMRGTAELPDGTYTYRPFALIDDAQPGDILYAFTTWYSDKTGKNLAANRRTNIQLAADRCDGTVLQPGEQFSYNALCAPYQVKNGYVDAPNISKDGHGVGGGVCQLTTTIYDAVLGLPLRVDEWQVHRVMGVVYVPQNLDACVSNKMDFKFTNTFDYPITIETITQNGALTCIIRRSVNQ